MLARTGLAICWIAAVTFIAYMVRAGVDWSNLASSEGNAAFIAGLVMFGLVCLVGLVIRSIFARR